MIPITTIILIGVLLGIVLMLIGTSVTLIEGQEHPDYHVMLPSLEQSAANAFVTAELEEQVWRPNIFLERTKGGKFKMTDKVQCWDIHALVVQFERFGPIVANTQAQWSWALSLDRQVEPDPPTVILGAGSSLWLNGDGEHIYRDQDGVGDVLVQNPFIRKYPMPHLQIDDDSRTIGYLHTAAHLHFSYDSLAATEAHTVALGCIARPVLVDLDEMLFDQASISQMVAAASLLAALGG